MKKAQDEYMEPTVYEYPNAIVRVYRPILTEAERARRMKEIRKAAEALLKSMSK